MALQSEEQEVTINMLRNEEIAEIYCSDTTWINKLNKLCEKSPDIYQKVSETEYGCTYKFPKNMITLRSSVRTVTMTDEEKEAARIRLAEARNKRKKEE